MKELIKKINTTLSNKIVLILLVGFMARLVLAKYGTLDLDFNTFISWSATLNHYGLSGFYQNTWSDYLPGYLYVLALLAKINTLGIIPQYLLYKLPAILADSVTGWLIYTIARKLTTRKWAQVSAALYVFNPATFANSAMWGQVDAFTALFSLLAVYLAGINPVASAISLTVGVGIKPQAALVGGVILWLALYKKWPVKKLATYMAVSGLVLALLFVPFATGTSASYFPQFVFGRLAQTLNQYPYTSVNAFNLWGVLGLWRPDTALTSTAGIALVAVVYVYVSSRLKQRGAKYVLLSVLFLAGFTFMTRMHERHLLPALAPLAASIPLYPALLIPYVTLSGVYLANLYYSFNWVTFSQLAVFDTPMVTFFSALVVLSLAVTIYIVTTSKRLAGSTSLFKPVNLKLQKVTNPKWLLAAILVFAFVARVYALGNPNHEYFDEVYHAFTAKEMLAGNPAAWEWWNTPPQGFAYEWTHPPLAKEAMVVGMSALGVKSFGWRFPAAFAGVGVVYLVYLIAKKLFGSERVALVAAFLASLDGLLLVMSRIGMNDIYMLVFALSAVYFALKQKYLPSAVFLGLALASKWSALWVIPVLGLIWLVTDRRFKLSLVWYVVLPPLVYLASYIPLFASGHSFDIFIGVQKQMWWYHTGLEATHPYTSKWWSWPLMLRPVYLYLGQPGQDLTAKIYALGNPLLLWSGLASVVFAGVYAVRNKALEVGLAVFAYLVFFVPWAVSPRIMFFYHYLPSIPFMAILLAWVTSRWPTLQKGLLIVCALTFVYFYPHWTGLTVPTWLDNSYYWLAGWR